MFDHFCNHLYILYCTYTLIYTVYCIYNVYIYVYLYYRILQAGDLRSILTPQTMNVNFGLCFRVITWPKVLHVLLRFEVVLCKVSQGQ